MSSEVQLRAFLAQDPGNPEIACDLIDLQLTAGQPEAARLTLANLPNDVQRNPGVSFRASRIDLATGDYGAAHERLRALIELGHDAPAIGHDLAFAQLCQRRTDAAAATISRTIARHGASPELHVLRARVALMDGDHAQAQHSLDEALRMEPDHATAMGVRALGLLDSGNLPSAQAAAADCLARYPDQHEALLASATAHLWTGNPALAGEQYQRALARFPNSGRALSGMGQVLAMAGHLEQAEATLRHAVRTMPDHIGTWHALGWVQLLQGDLPEARNSYQAAYDLDRNFAESHGGLAVVAFFEDRFEDGEASMKRALKLDPKCVSGRYAKTLWLYHTNQAEASDALFAELMEQGALPGIDPLQASQAAERLRARATSRRSQG